MAEWIGSGRASSETGREASQEVFELSRDGLNRVGSGRMSSEVSRVGLDYPGPIQKFLREGIRPGKALKKVSNLRQQSIGLAYFHTTAARTGMGDRPPGINQV